MIGMRQHRCVNIRDPASPLMQSYHLHKRVCARARSGQSVAECGCCHCTSKAYVGLPNTRVLVFNFVAVVEPW